MSKQRWESLGALPPFTTHKHYLQVTTAAVSEDDFKVEGWVHRACACWCKGWRRSGGAVAHPYPEKKKDPNRTRPCTACITSIGSAPPPEPGPPAPRGTLNLNPAVEQLRCS